MVFEGDTLILLAIRSVVVLVADISPISGSIVAVIPVPVTIHVSVADWPGLICDGAILNSSIIAGLTSWVFV